MPPTLTTRMVRGRTVVITTSNRCLSELHLDMLKIAEQDGLGFSTVDSDMAARDDLVSDGLLELVSDGLLSDYWLITDLGRAALCLAGLS